MKLTRSLLMTSSELTILTCVALGPCVVFQHVMHNARQEQQEVADDASLPARKAREGRMVLLALAGSWSTLFRGVMEE
jgi:hypothetical protein